MFYLVTGGSGSGKSEYAENLLLSLGLRRRIYVATMIPWDEECRNRIARHRRMRALKGFETVEQYRDLDMVRIDDAGGDEWAAPAVLLECLANLTANELYNSEKNDRILQKLFNGVLSLKDQCTDLVAVTNEVFSDGICYDPETREYQRILGALNRKLAAEADRVIEVVYGIPIILKQETEDEFDR